jgi:hypothetical protein
MAEDRRPPDLVPGDTAQPSNRPIDEMVRSDVLRDENDEPYVVDQMPVGADNVKGGGEWPDPDAPPQAPAPGSDPAEAAAIAKRRHERAVRDPEQDERLKDVLEQEPDRSASKATPD